MLYKTLYKKNNSNSITVWNIHYGTESYWTEYGVLNGKMISTNPTLVTSKNVGKKNETTTQEQVFKEMESLIKYKLDCDGYCEDVNDVDNIDKIYYLC